MIIRNFKKLASSKLRKDALTILEDGFASLSTENIIKQQIRLHKNQFLFVKDTCLDLTKYKKIYLVGIGKAAFSSVAALEKLLEDFISDGIVLDIYGGKLKKVRSLVGSHPVATQANVAATKEIISLVEKADEDDLVIAVISGGGSALLCSPYQISCETKSQIVKSLVEAGASIKEINTVRKHLSEIKGGNFAKLVYPAKLLALIFSDVPGDDLDMIASGPTVLDTTTVQDAAKILAKYNVLKMCKLPNCELKETPKETYYFQQVENIIIANNQLPLLAMEKKARNLGYKAEIFSARLEGQAFEVAKTLVRNSKPKTALLAAGETTVKVRGKGVGGRNQHLVLSALRELKNNQVIASVNSDGFDNTPYAGAIGDYQTIEKAQAQKINIQEVLKNCDSFRFFQATGDGIETGILGSNVADFMLVLSS